MVESTTFRMLLDLITRQDVKISEHGYDQSANATLYVAEVDID